MPFIHSPDHWRQVNLPDFEKKGKKESICIRATSVLWGIKSASVNRFPLRIFRAAISLREIYPSYWLEHRTFNIEFLFRTREFTALGCYPKPSEIWNVLELRTISLPIFTSVYRLLFLFHFIVFACWTVIRETGDLKLQKLIQGNFLHFCCGWCCCFFFSKYYLISEAVIHVL